jgi:signal transduction histidine kinase
MLIGVLLILPPLVLLQRLFTDQPGGTGLLAVLSLGSLLLAVPFALVLSAVECWRLRLVDDRPLTPIQTASGSRLWRSLGHLLLLATVLPLGYAVAAALTLLTVVWAASPLLLTFTDSDRVALGMVQVDTLNDALPYCVAGIVLLPAMLYLFGLLAGAQAATTRALLAADAQPQLRADLVEVSRSRARLVDAFEAERRRIERDLHDGAQQRLISLTLQLGLARLDLPADSPALANVSAAHEQAKLLMAELRELIHGIRPQTLADLGLPAALHELAEKSQLTAVVDVTGLPVRPAGPAEHAAYFVVAEALTNVARHSGGTVAQVRAYQRDGLLTVEVHDDGRGGAAATEGSGLTGLADRVAAIGGRMLLSSPPGGPTLLRAEFPCPSA